MTELETQVIEIEIFGYINDKGQKVFTPNLEFAHIMATKYGTKNVYLEKK
jgi:hypothetical protein